MSKIRGKSPSQAGGLRHTGTVAVLYATGAGQPSSPGITGNFSAYTRLADFPAPKLPVRVTVGGIPAEILYASEAPLAVTGLFQVNFRVPPDARLADAVPLILMVGKARSPDGVTMAIRSSAQRVLVIDRDPSARGSLAKTLEADGYEVLTARDGHHAGAVTKGHFIDLMICDFAIDELEALLAMTKDRPHLKVVAMSAAPDPDFLRAADMLGARAVFTKPLTQERVLQRIHELLPVRSSP